MLIRYNHLCEFHGMISSYAERWKINGLKSHYVLTSHSSCPLNYIDDTPPVWSIKPITTLQRECTRIWRHRAVLIIVIWHSPAMAKLCVCLIIYAQNLKCCYPRQVTLHLKLFQFLGQNVIHHDVSQSYYLIHIPPHTISIMRNSLCDPNMDRQFFSSLLKKWKSGKFGLSSTFQGQHVYLLTFYLNYCSCSTEFLDATMETKSNLWLWPWNEVTVQLLVWSTLQLIFEIFHIPDVYLRYWMSEFSERNPPNVSMKVFQTSDCLANRTLKKVLTLTHIMQINHSKRIETCLCFLVCLILACPYVL